MKKSSKSPETRQSDNDFIQQIYDYCVDFWQRTILFGDVMRQRSNKYFQHNAMPVPHVLSFETELVLDGRKFERPVNYGLVQIKPPEGVTLDLKKRPFIVVDPRAGHGPGIGGFKTDSEIGVALRAGHPCYFIGFSPNPMPEQTIEDIMKAEAIFLEKVIEMHPNAEGKPCVIGNCQAGWAIMMLASTCPELFGPIIIAGSPLSYWAGIEGKNPMRYSAGLLGGSWLTALAGDLGNGKFNGAYLVGNFENLNPANTLWTKYYNLWANIDTEAKRFLEFETWWGGHVNLNAGEIQWIVDQLFIGNRLATAEIITTDRVRIDLRNIRSPIVCFCSKGDNITPPQQALGWIIDLYENDEDIIACNQTIVYAIHENIGHLGIFVSGDVARKEHEEFTSNIDLIDILPPGLYEAVMVPKTSDVVHPDLIVGDWITCFERRSIEDVRTIVQPKTENELRFAAVRRVSEINLGLYRTLFQPFAQAFSNEQTAALLEKINPVTLPFELFSDDNPVMQQIAILAKQVRRNRRPLSAGNPLLRVQSMISEKTIATLNNWRDFRDKMIEQIFMEIYSVPLLQAFVGLRASDENIRHRPGREPSWIEFTVKRIDELKRHIANGGMHEAAIRSLIYIEMNESMVDERNFEILRRIRTDHNDITLAELKNLIREQFFAILLDREAALAAIPTMLSVSPGDTAKALDTIIQIVSVTGKPAGVENPFQEGTRFRCKKAPQSGARRQPIPV